jgi:1,4-alpha-glucan branching enzyme
MHDKRKVIAFHRWDKGGPADDVVVVANFFHEPQEGYVIGFPSAGTWKLRFNSDWQGYAKDFGGHPSADVVTEPGPNDGLPFHATCSIGPYSVLIFSQGE